MHEVLVNRLGGLSLPRKSVVRLTDRPDMTLDVYRGRKTTIQPTNRIYGKEGIVFTFYVLVDPLKCFDINPGTYFITAAQNHFENTSHY